MARKIVCTVFDAEVLRGLKEAPRGRVTTINDLRVEFKYPKQLQRSVSRLAALGIIGLCETADEADVILRFRKNVVWIAFKPNKSITGQQSGTTGQQFTETGQQLSGLKQGDSEETGQQRETMGQQFDGLLSHYPSKRDNNSSKATEKCSNGNKKPENGTIIPGSVCKPVDNPPHALISNTKDLNKLTNPPLNQDLFNNKYPPLQTSTHRGRRPTKLWVSMTDNERALFDRFWGAYPKKVGKGDAERAWTKIEIDRHPELFKTIMESIDEHISSAKWVAGFIVNPSTFINQRRWEDNPVESGSSGSRFGATTVANIGVAKAWLARGGGNGGSGDGNQ